MTVHFKFWHWNENTKLVCYSDPHCIQILAELLFYPTPLLTKLKSLFFRSQISNRGRFKELQIDSLKSPFFRYTQRHKKELTSASWTSKEDKRLVELVDKCRINNFIPWPKVSRSWRAKPQQCLKYCGSPTLWGLKYQTHSYFRWLNGIYVTH